MAYRPGRSGEVSEFDEHRGLGVVRSDDGHEHVFHCTAIADGSRSIEVGTPVRYRVVAGRGGRWEAVELVAGSSAVPDGRATAGRRPG